MKFKERNLIYKSFEHGNHRIENVPYQVNTEISDPIDEDLILSGPVMLRLMQILGHMEQNDLLVFNYESELT